jgi:hypothetical protein
MATLSVRHLIVSSFCFLTVLSGCVKLPTEVNRPPSPPVLTAVHSYSTVPSILLVNSIDPDGDLLAYQFEVHDPDTGSTLLNWTSYFPSGENAVFLFQVEQGNYDVRVRARDTMNETSDFSDKVSLVFADINMSPIGSVTVPGEAGDLVVRGDYAYLSTSENGLQVVDVSNSTLPRVAGGDATFSSWDVDCNNQAVFLLGGSTFHEFLCSYDVSSPSTPIRLNQIPIYGAEQLDVEGGYALVGTGFFGRGIALVDITDPSRLVTLSSLSVGSPVVGVALRYPYAYVMTNIGSRDTIHVVDLYDVQAPSVLGSLALTDYGPISEGPGGYLYEVGRESFSVINVEAPHNPQLVSQSGEASIGLDGGLHYSSNYLGVAEGFIGCLKLFDVTYPDSPYLIGQYCQAQSCNGVWCGDGYVYATVDSDKLLVFGYPLPGTSPRIAGQFSTGGDTELLFDNGHLKLSVLLPKK